MWPNVSADAWAQIGRHLKPRHLAKLMRVSKRVRAAVDNEAYWTRVAAHMVWRGTCVAVPIPPVPGYNTYNMLWCEHGYFANMERFVERIHEAVDVLSRGEVYSWTAKGWMPSDWAARRGMDLRTLTCILAEIDENPQDIWHLTMREVAKTYYVERYNLEADCGDGFDYGCLTRFVSALDDDPDIPAAHKLRLMAHLKCHGTGHPENKTCWPAVWWGLMRMEDVEGIDTAPFVSHLGRLAAEIVAGGHRYTVYDMRWFAQRFV